MRFRLEGKWEKGFAFDLHTVASTYLGPDEHGHHRFENTRSEIGELVYRLKYKGDLSAVQGIVDLLAAIRGIESFDAIIPVPSSNRRRPYQPVDEIAKALGARRGVAVLSGFLAKTGSGPPLKGIDDPAERARLLRGSLVVNGRRDISGFRVLLLDDLYRSGATLNACSSILYERCGVASVSVLTMTRTRSKR